MQFIFIEFWQTLKYNMYLIHFCYVLDFWGDGMITLYNLKCIIRTLTFTSESLLFLDYLVCLMGAVLLRWSLWVDIILGFLVVAVSVGLPTILDLVNRSTIEYQKLLNYKMVVSICRTPMAKKKRRVIKNTFT